MAGWFHPLTQPHEHRGVAFQSLPATNTPVPELSSGSDEEACPGFLSLQITSQAFFWVVTYNRVFSLVAF